MTFMELLEALEHRLGYQHVPLNTRASSLKQIFECSPVHHDLMHRLVQSLYRANGCRQLTDKVEREACFAAIGPVRQDVLKTPSTDVDAYHLIEELCHVLDEIFATSQVSPAKPEPQPKQTAEVIKIGSARRRRDDS